MTCECKPYYNQATHYCLQSIIQSFLILFYNQNASYIHIHFKANNLFLQIKVLTHVPPRTVLPPNPVFRQAIHQPNLEFWNLTDQVSNIFPSNVSLKHHIWYYHNEKLNHSKEYKKNKTYISIRQRKVISGVQSHDTTTSKT